MHQVIDILINTINIVGEFLAFAIIARVLLSWVKPGAERSSRIGEVIFQITEPLMDLARRFPHRVSMIDLSPIIAFVMIDLVSFVLVEILKRIV